MSNPIYFFFAINYFAQGMSGLVYEPISYLLKDGLKLSAAQSSTFIWWMTLPFLIKPVFGLLSDYLPIRGFRRKPHIAIVAGSAALAWAALAFRPGAGYYGLLALLVLVNVGVAASDVICDGVMVEQGKAEGKTGLFQAVQIGTLYAALVITGLGGGWLAAHVSMRKNFALAAIFPAMIALSSFWTRESGEKKRSLPGGGELLGLLRDRKFWAISAFIFLWSFYPFLGTAEFYYQSDVLKLSPVFIGLLDTLGGFAGVAGAAFYGRVIGRRFKTADLIKGAVLVYGPLSLLFLLYLGPVSVAIVTVVLGVAGVAFRLALMDLAAQSCPKGAEATAFAAYMSVFNLAASASNAAGGHLYEVFKRIFSAQANPAYLAIAALTFVGTTCTFSCWWLLPAVLRNDAAGA